VLICAAVALAIIALSACSPLALKRERKSRVVTVVRAHEKILFLGQSAILTRTF
jgi:hypothetical protein